MSVQPTKPAPGLAQNSPVQVRNHRRMRMMLARLSRRVETLAMTRREVGVEAIFAAMAINNIHNVVEYPSTIPEPGGGSILPVCAKVREKPSVIAESSHVRY